MIAVHQVRDVPPEAILGLALLILGLVIARQVERLSQQWREAERQEQVAMLEREYFDERDRYDGGSTARMEALGARLAALGSPITLETVHRHTVGAGADSATVHRGDPHDVVGSRAAADVAALAEMVGVADASQK